LGRRWPKDERMRQIVEQRAASEILRLMFSRWVQENDFKYPDKHFWR
jgi:hypothetical protein